MIWANWFLRARCAPYDPAGPGAPATTIINQWSLSSAPHSPRACWGSPLTTVSVTDSPLAVLWPGDTTAVLLSLLISRCCSSRALLPARLSLPPLYWSLLTPPPPTPLSLLLLLSSERTMGWCWDWLAPAPIFRAMITLRNVWLGMFAPATPVLQCCSLLA